MEEEEEIINLEQFEVKEKLGSGSFGIVYLIENKSTHERYAAKVSKDNKFYTSNFSKELKTYLKAKHPTILNYYGYSPNNFNNQPYPTVILEYMSNGSLSDQIKSEKIKLTSEIKYIILLGISIGMKFLHSIKIIHRDLKTQNILIDENFYPRICDFGESYLSDNLNLSKLLMSSFRGTPKYMAPEIYKEDFYTYKIDVYSFSLVMYEIITEREAFSEYKKINQLRIAVEKGIRPDLSLIKDVDIQNFIKKCWDNNPQNRPSFTEIVEEIQSEKFKKFFNVDEEAVSKYLEMIKEKSNSPYLYKYKADEGDLKSMIIYGCSRFIGIDSKVNMKEAAKYFKMAADKGDIYGLNNYFYMIFSDVITNKEECKYYVEKAINLYPNDPVILYYCGKCYLFGKCGEINYEKAAELFKISADLEFPYSIYNYGKMLFYGYGVSINKEEGIKYFKKAADLNVVDAIASYGEVLFKGECCEMNKEEGIKYLKLAADKGNKFSAWFCSIILLNGDGVSVNIEEGLKYLKFAADKRFDDSCLMYADILYNSIYIQPNKEEAAKYYKMAADDGNIEAINQYSYMLLEGDGIKMNVSEAIKYLKIAAEKENDVACVEMAKLLYSGKKIQQNKKEAAIYFKKSADNGNVFSQWFYGTMLLEGDGIEINKKKAIDYIKKAADKNFECAIICYAKSNLDGIDDELNKEEALQLIKNLADKGNIDAMYEYGSILKYGQYDFNKDEIEASRYFKISAEKGKIESMYEYSTLLLEKTEDSQNKQEGYKYLKIAADDGFTLAMIKYSILVFKQGKIEEGIHYLKMSIDCDNDYAMFLYGIILYEGYFNIPINKQEAAKYFKMAADRGNLEGMERYKDMLIDGDGIQKNFKEAKQYLKILADNGNVQSMNEYGSVLMSLSDDNEIEAYKYFKMGAEKGNKEAMHNLAMLLLEGNYIKHDYKQGEKYLKKSADLGFVYAMGNYGILKSFCENAENDKEEGFKYIEMAYKLKDKFTEINIEEIELSYANFMIFENKNVKDSSKYIQIIKKYADSGNLMAMKMYGCILQEGKGIDKNIKEANHYFKMIADKGDIEACYVFGYNLINGEGITKNIDEGIKYLKIAVNSGHFEATQFYVKFLFEMSDKMEINSNELTDCIKNLADKGDVYNMYLYGMMLLFGDLIPINKEKGSYYIKKSADKGFELAIYQYGVNLYYGNGVPINRAESALYLKKAANEGVIYSMYKYGQLFNDKINEVVDYLKNEIDKGNTFAMYLYAVMLYKGEGIKMDKVKSFNYFLISAYKGNIYSMIKIISKRDVFNINILQTMIFKRFVLTRFNNFFQENLNFSWPFKIDYNERKKNSIQLLEMGVAQGDLKSIIKYAKKLYNGKLLKVDKKKAAGLFKMAADKGDVYSMNKYGYMLLKGDGIPINEDEANHYLCMSLKKVGFDESLFSFLNVNFAHLF